MEARPGDRIFRAKFELGASALCLGYVGTILLITNRGPGTIIGKMVGSAGRMALTVYLSETIISTFVMYHWGLGKFDTFTRVELIGFVVAVYAALVVFATIWMHFFRVGPMEWLWRSLSYLRPIPLTRSTGKDSSQ